MTNSSKSIKASFVIATVVMLSVLSLSGSISGHSQRRRSAHKPRSANSTKPPAPRAINAEEMQSLLKRDASRPLLVNFWATWCDPCREEFPDLVRIDADYRAKGLDFITVSLDDMAELKTEVPKFLRLMKARMPSYLLNVSDPEPAIKYVDPQWSGALPGTILYNAKGEIVFKHFGRVNAVELRAAINKVMNDE